MNILMTETKQSHLPSMEWLKSFEAAGRLGNFTAAGNEIGLTQASISQHIRTLENNLGTRLFRRLPRGVELTIEGEAYLGHVSNALSLIRRGTTELFGRPHRKKITIIGPASVAALWVSPRLNSFSKTNPDVEIAVSSIYRQVDYELVESDYEIRFGAGNWAGRRSVQLFQEKLLPVCAPHLITNETNWRDLPILAITGIRDGWHDWAQSGGQAPLDKPSLRFDSFLTAFHAARAGAGVVLASKPMIKTDLLQRTLIPVDDHTHNMSSGHWITWPQNQMTDTVHDDLISALRQ